MSEDPNVELEEFFKRLSASAVKSLDSTIDVHQRLRDFHRERTARQAASSENTDTSPTS
jgi:hypothetical protein